jgi:hypothetical protein
MFLPASANIDREDFILQTAEAVAWAIKPVKE